MEVQLIAMSPRVLVIDDSRTTLEVVRVHLMNLGYDFITAGNASDAFSMALQNPPDLIISDLFMPGVTGLDLCKKIRATPVLRKVPFVVITAKKESVVRRDAFAAGVNGFLLKPIDAQQLRQLVAELLNRRRSAAGLR